MNAPNEIIDKICDSYEQRWLEGDGPPDLNAWIEEHVGTVSRELLVQLLRVDVEYRKKLQPDFDSKIYLERFRISEEELSSDRHFVDDSTAQLPKTTRSPSRHAVPDQIGRFEIIREVGRGGFGCVYLAKDKALGREVALKISRSLLTDDTNLRLHREASMAALLEHSGIVPVLEVGEWCGEFYVVSAFCPGKNLSQQIKSSTKRCPRACAQIVHQLAEATQHAHDRGVVHRDLKPGNVMMVPRDTSEDELPYSPRITDFGLAKLVEQRLEDTHSSQMLGTPAYMAPEQFQSEENGHPFSTDIYSIGVILYELLTGRRPHEGKTFPEVMDGVRSGEFPPPSEFNNSVPRDLETICLKCLQFRPADRYPSCAELVEDLQRFLQGRPISAKRPGVTDQLQAWFSRPARRYEAGIMSMFAGFIIPLWISIAFVLVWKDGLEASFSGELFPQPAALFLFVLFPLGYAGYRTMKGSRGWAWFALMQSLIAIVQVVPPLFGVVLVFPELYNRYPLGRIIAYSLVSLVFVIQVAQYAIVLRFSGTTAPSHRD